MRVEVVPYDGQWPQQFVNLQAELATCLAGVSVVGIEHVGSTAVPGLAAKPVIDIDVVVESADVAAAVEALVTAGHTYLGDCGIPDRYALVAPVAGPARHVYVAVAGSVSLRNHLAVRDVLRADAALRDEYGALKLGLAAHDHPSIDDYVAAKSTVLQRVLRRGGFTDEELAAIDALNTS